MKCQLCRKRTGAHQRKDEGLGLMLLICEKCRRDFYPTPEEELVDDEQEMYRSERAYELGAHLG